MSWRPARIGENVNGRSVRRTTVEVGDLNKSGTFTLHMIERRDYEVEENPFPKTVGSLIKAKFKDDEEQSLFAKSDFGTYCWINFDDGDQIREDSLELVEVVFEAPEGLFKR